MRSTASPRRGSSSSTSRSWSRSPQASASLHHSLAAGHARDALGAYPVVFFSMWWIYFAHPGERVAVPVACVAVAVAAFLPESVFLVGLVLAGLVAVMTVAAARAAEPAQRTDGWP